MAIKKENLEALGTVLGIANLATMVSDSEEHELDITPFAVMKKTDLTTREGNIRKEGYDEGKSAGEEVLIKAIRDEFGIEKSALSKKADAKKIKEAVHAKVAAELGVAPDKRLGELQSDIVSLQETVRKKDEKITELTSTFERKERQATNRQMVLGKLPEKTKIPKDAVVNLFFLEHSIETEGDNVVIKKGGQVVKNDVTRAPKTLDEYIPEFVTPYAEDGPGGGAGGNDKPNPSSGAPGTMKAFLQEMSDKGVNEGSAKFNQEMRERRKAGTLKD